MAAVYLKRGPLHRLAAGHPWVYANEVQRVEGTPGGGDIVDIRDHKGRFLGRGYYNAQSQIVVRRLTREAEEVDEAFFLRRIQAAIAFRQSLMPHGPWPAANLASAVASLRVVYSEADFLPGLIVDQYGGALVAQFLTLGMERRKETLVKLLADILRPAVILERSDAPSRKLEGLDQAKGALWPAAGAAKSYPAQIEINGLQFSVDLLAGQKTGFFLDQAENYRVVSQLVSNLQSSDSRHPIRVLDCFCHQGGFALHAARAGAARVIGVEMSEEALAVARKNAELNVLSDRCEWIAANVFDYLSAATKRKADPHSPVSDPFDLIILDPPTFTRTRQSVEAAARGYKEIHLRALKLLRPGGLLVTFCCSHHIDRNLFLEIVVVAAADAHCDLRLLRLLSQSADHPILPAVPETEYLKGFALQMV